MKKCSVVLHVAALGLEWLIVETIVFGAAVSEFPLHDRVYSDKAQDIIFSVAKGQEDWLADLNYFRVDYTTHSRPVANDDSDFIAEQMILVPRNRENPYAEYSVRLPADVLKVRINTHYYKGREHNAPLSFEKVILGGRALATDEFTRYFNRPFCFYGMCYVPHPVFRGYYVEYIVIVVVSILVFAGLGLWCFQRRGGRK